MPGMPASMLRRWTTPRCDRHPFRLADSDGHHVDFDVVPDPCSQPYGTETVARA
ncbi:hypothetical protein VM1G_06092 [Cytospora mali]|uniref:Uncharacterized protein n=1 Tax=Cytospora mali TaxID=578113 RepID=A0A194W139_CYTMA|nr:hypothetical protein VM1G_06092 [Valsa mali]